MQLCDSKRVSVCYEDEVFSVYRGKWSSRIECNDGGVSSGTTALQWNSAQEASIEDGASEREIANAEQQ